MSHWSVTGNEKSRGERCNYSGIYESEGALYDLMAHLVHAHTHADTKSCTCTDKEEPDTIGKLSLIAGIQYIL